ncbi:MAG: DNA polymerase III subunit delta [Planctomycetales bacterium]
MHATAYLQKPEKSPTGPCAVIFGGEGYLRQRALAAVSEQVVGSEADDEMSVVRLSGKTVDLAAVTDELRMVSMWGDRRLIIVEEADDFVKQYRGGLEKYVQNPVKKSVLLLLVNSWPSNTRLAKMVAELGLDLDCGALKPAELFKWLAEHAKGTYEKQLTRDAAQQLVELAGTDLGQLDQELSKLASYVGDQPQISVDAVRTLVGGWKAETTWGMLDAVRDGKIDVALHLLDKLLTAGEHPLKLLGGINYTFKPLGQGTEASRQGLSLRESLIQAGVKPFQVGAAESYLRRIGRPRAERIYRWLQEADTGLKGASALPDRVLMERLLLELAGKV